ncbi:MAG: hypothetical protein A2Y92_02040 [Chloroflexi bacterium RBG_13_57_8]|nr:MAG: hypothetical protein A2Y92_02040 [Chloroflexi bacterium RBG_13_57_8]
MDSRAVNARHVPQRTCVACRRVRNKRELVRLVCAPSGDIEIDATGKKEGRGAYICPDRACWGKALKGKALEVTLRTGISRVNRDKLWETGKDLVEGVT